MRHQPASYEIFVIVILWEQHSLCAYFLRGRPFSTAEDVIVQQVHSLSLFRGHHDRAAPHAKVAVTHCTMHGCASRSVLHQHVSVCVHKMKQRYVPHTTRCIWVEGISLALSTRPMPWRHGLLQVRPPLQPSTRPQRMPDVARIRSFQNLLGTS